MAIIDKRVVGLIEMYAPNVWGEALGLLKRSRDRILDPANWCRNSLARNVLGEEVGEPTSFAATQWCALGSVMRESGYASLAYLAEQGGGPDLMLATALLGSESFRRGYVSIADLNDTEGHAVTLTCFEAAIGQLEAHIARSSGLVAA